MSEIESALMYLGLGFALSVIFIGKRSGGCMRNPPPPDNYIKPSPPPPPPRPFLSGYQPTCCSRDCDGNCQRKVKPPPKRP